MRVRECGLRECRSWRRGDTEARSEEIGVQGSGPQAVPRPDILRREKLLPPHAVILHNDDVNEMDYVVLSLLRCVPDLTSEEAVSIMLEAHNHGQAVVIVCPLELAELYRERLESCGLTATIEKA